MRESQNVGDPVGARAVGPPKKHFPARHALREQEALWSEFLAMGQTRRLLAR